MLIVMSAAFFGSAGTWNWPEAWVYLFIQFSFAIGVAAWLKKNNPELLEARMKYLKRSAKSWDKAIVVFATAAFIPLLVLPGLDAVRYKWSEIPLPVTIVAFASIIISMTLVFWVMRENRFASRLVEIQRERGHEVVTSGPYQYVRHPMYVGVMIIWFSVPLALGSLWALIPGAVMATIFVVRTHLEDRMLHEELEGYVAYAQRVRYRLVPGIW